jgi:hypothetical protein
MAGDAADTDRAFAAIAKDISGKGIGLVTHHFLMVSEVVVCLWSDGEPKLLLAAVRHRRELSRGWVRFGVEVIRLITRNEHPELYRFVELLLKPQPQPEHG